MKSRTYHIFLLGAVLLSASVVSCTKLPTFLGGDDSAEKKPQTGASSFTVEIRAEDGLVSGDVTEKEPALSVYVEAESSSLNFSASYRIDGSSEMRLDGIQSGRYARITKGVSGLLYGRHELSITVTCSETGESVSASKPFFLRESFEPEVSVCMTDGKGHERLATDGVFSLYTGETVDFTVTVTPKDAHVGFSLASDSEDLSISERKGSPRGTTVFSVTAGKTGDATLLLTADNAIDEPETETFPVSVRAAIGIDLSLIRLDTGEECKNNHVFATDLSDVFPVELSASPRTYAIDSYSLVSSNPSIIRVEPYDASHPYLYSLSFPSYGKATLTATVCTQGTYIEKEFNYTVTSDGIQVRAVYDEPSADSTLEFLGLPEAMDIEIRFLINIDQNHPQVTYYYPSYRSDGSAPQSEAECKALTVQKTDIFPLEEKQVTIAAKTYRVSPSDNTLRFSCDYLANGILAVLSGSSPYEGVKNRQWEWKFVRQEYDDYKGYYDVYEAEIIDMNTEDSRYTLPRPSSILVFYTVKTASLSKTPVTKTADSSSYFVLLRSN